MFLLQKDRDFLSYLKGLSIFVIVFGHVGGFWVFRPYSEFLHVFIPIFFFISGAVSFLSFNRTSGVKEYYLKRFSRLLIPYCLLCILCLVVFLIINRRFPLFDIVNILKWIQIRPTSDMTPFSIGQVWFLHTLFFVTLLSPIYFFGNNLYKPIVHSSFYIFGIICFGTKRIRNLKFLIPFFIFCLVSSVCLVYLFNLNIDYGFHIFAPDIYYVLGSFAAIVAMLIFYEYFVKLIQYNVVIDKIFTFFHKNTFSIFLLHTFSIYLAEEIVGLANPSEKTITYGMIKLVVVLAITSILAIPFTQLSSTMTTLLMKKLLPDNL